jgi:hypothetical protein
MTPRFILMLRKHAGWSIVAYGYFTTYLTFAARLADSFRIFVFFGAFVTVKHSLFCYGVIINCSVQIYCDCIEVVF